MSSTWRDFRAHTAGVVGYRVPDLRGLTVAEAVDQWEWRFGGSRFGTTEPHSFTTIPAPDDAPVTTAIEGFTGGVSPSDAPSDAIVTSFTTVPASAVGSLMPAATALILDFLAYLVTPGGDQLTTPSGDPLTT